MISIDHLHFPAISRRKSYTPHSNYDGYRQEIREDCLGRCVYCDAHENEIGGKEHMSIDHFRPQAFYPELENDPQNLLWACHTCNGLKGRKWPAIGTASTYIGGDGFIDPFEENRSDYMRVETSGNVLPIKDPAGYIVSELRLNRPTIQGLRKKRSNSHILRQNLEKFIDEEIGTIDKLLLDENLSDLDKARFREEVKRYERIGELLCSLGFDPKLY